MPTSCQACRTAPSPTRASLLPTQGRKPHTGHPPLTLLTYLSCGPLPGLQSVVGSRTKQFMAMWSARTATSMPLRSLALRRDRASLRAQEGSSQQLLARVGMWLGPTSPDPKLSAQCPAMVGKALPFPPGHAPASAVAVEEHLGARVAQLVLHFMRGDLVLALIQVLVAPARPGQA